MFLIKILLFLILHDFFPDPCFLMHPTKAAIIRNLSPNEIYLERQIANKRDVERDHLKSFRIVAEHVGPSESPSSGEQIRNPKYDSVEFEEKNVDTVEEVVTALEEVGTVAQEGRKSRRHVDDSSNPKSYPTFENLKERSESDDDSVNVDPSFRNRRSGMLFRHLYTGDDFDEISDQYPKIGSIHEKDLQKRLSYEIEDLFNNSSPYKTSRDTATDMSPTVQEGNDHLNGRKEYRNTSANLEVPIKRNLETLTSASHDLNHSQSPNNVITPQPDVVNSSNVKNDTKRTSPPGSSGKKTKYIDLNDPTLNFSYEGKPGDDIVLRIDRQGSQLDNQSEKRKKEDKTSKLGERSSTNIKEIGKKVEVIKETIISSGDNDTLNISNAVPENVEDVFKIAMPLMKLDKDSGGRVKWNVREDTGGSKYFDIGNQPESRDDVIYVVDKHKREVECDSFILELFKSNVFVATLIFVLIVIVVVLLLTLIYNMGLRSVMKRKYEKVSNEDFAHDGPTPRAGSKNSKSYLGYMKVLPSSMSIKRLIGIRASSSGDEDKSTSESEEKNRKNVRDDNKEKRSSRLDKPTEYKVDERKAQQKQDKKSQSRELSAGKRKKGIYMKDNGIKTIKQITRKISFQKVEDRGEEIRIRTLKEQRQKLPARDESSQRSKDGKAAVEKHQSSKLKDNSKRYSTESKANGPILSYERIQKHKPKCSNSSIECPCVDTDSNTGVLEKVKTSMAPRGNTDQVSTTNNGNRKFKIMDWIQHKLSSDPQTSSDENESRDKVKRSDGESSNESSVGTKIKDMFFGQKGDNQTTEDSDSDTKKLKKVVRDKKNKSKNLRKKRDTQTKNQKIDLPSLVSDIDSSSSEGRQPRAKPTELVHKIVTTGECKRVDDMLRGRGWQRSLYYGQGMKTLDSGHESFDHQPGVDAIGNISEVKAALKNSSSSQALQDEIGKLINIAENNIKKGEPTYDPPK